MITLNILNVDVVTKAVTTSSSGPAGALPDLEKLGNDLIVQVNFVNGGQAVSFSIPDNAPATSILLTLKQQDTGEIVLQSDAWALTAGNYYVHASISGSPLAAMLGTVLTSSTNLLGEIQWVQNNPFYGTPNGNIGPATIKTSSQNFAVTVAADLG